MGKTSRHTVSDRPIADQAAALGISSSEFVRRAYVAHNCNKTHTAKALGVCLSTIEHHLRRLERHGIITRTKRKGTATP